MSARVMDRRWDWALPPRPVHREVISQLPPEDVGLPPALLVAGFRHNARSWSKEWLPGLAARGCAAHAMSLRGCGGSGGAETRWRTALRHHVHDVLQVIVDLPRPPVLIGHGEGAAVVAHVIERYPAFATVLLAPLGGNGVSARALLRRSRTTPPLMQYQLLRRRPGPAAGPGPVLVLGPRDDAIGAAESERAAARYDGRAQLLAGKGDDLLHLPERTQAAPLVARWIAAAARERPANDADRQTGGSHAATHA